MSAATDAKREREKSEREERDLLMVWLGVRLACIVLGQPRRIYP